jgi:hypothetical protein
LAQQSQPPRQERIGLSTFYADAIIPAAGTQLVSGVPASFSLPKGSGLGIARGDLGFQIVVPDGSTTLQIQLVTTTPGVDVDLYVRFGQDVDIAGGQPVADYRSEGLTGNETLLITTGSTPPLKAGAYYIAFGIFNPVAASGNVTATVGTASNPPTPPSVVYAWQTDWNTYAAAVSPFLQTFPFSGSFTSITHPKFDGKQVTWQGTISSNPAVPNSAYVRISMAPVQLILSNGRSEVLSVLDLIPNPADIVSWNPQVLPTGKQISFRATLGTSFTGLTAGSISIFIPATVELDIRAYDAELLGQPPTISQNGVVNGASFQLGVVPNSWITIQGTSLAATTNDWNKAIVNGNLPTSLDGVSVNIGGKPAYINYVSPTQINAVAPDVGFGPMSVTVTNANGASVAFTATSQQFGPAFFLWASKYAGNCSRPWFCGSSPIVPSDFSGQTSRNRLT